MTSAFKVGFGYDIHRISETRKLILGGIHVPFQFGLEGHSDADVLSHAIADAIFGALGLPDIGHFFPPGDEKWRDMDSQVILRKAHFEAERLGYAISNIDSTLVAEAPKIGPYIPRMKGAIGTSLGIAPAQIGIKATTNEGLGPLGKGEGMAAYATALVYRL